MILLDWFNGLKPWQKVALVGGLLWSASAVAGGGSGASVPVRGLIQNDARWGKVQLGFGTSSIGGGGCLLTAMTMAFNSIRGAALIPPDVNEIAKNVRAFAAGSSNLVVETLAEALKLAVGKRVRNAPSDVGGMIEAVQQGLRNKGLAILHVDYEGDNDGDHFVLVNGMTAGGGYTAVDPVNGKTITLSSALRGSSKWGSVTKNYVPFGAFSLMRDDIVVV